MADVRHYLLFSFYPNGISLHASQVAATVSFQDRINFIIEDSAILRRA